VIHAFTDGRDVPPSDAKVTMPKFLDRLDEGIVVGTVTGRYYAMDRDNRWERVGMAYDVMVSAKGAAPNVSTPIEALEQGYNNELTDEFMLPTVVGDYAGMNDGDGILMCNFRSDRAREILAALASPNPPEDLGLGTDARAAQPAFAVHTGMVQYSDQHAEYMDTLFPPKDITKTLGEVVSDAGLTQLRAAETEKYPHVTFFFNGGREQPFEGEDRLLVASPKVATYDLQPEMSAPELSEKLCAQLSEGKFNMVIVNFANPDMVGHTGDLNAAILACEAVDSCLGDLRNVVKQRGGTLVVTADHGNCEKMWDSEGQQPHTAHTLNKVPVILAAYNNAEGATISPECKLRSGRLADIAPTMLQILGVAQPPEMTGESLLLAPDQLGSPLPDGPRFTRPPREGNPDAGSVPY